MKKTLIFASSMMAAFSAFSQGTINFNNFLGATTLRAPIFDVEPGNPTVSKQGNPSTGAFPVGTTTYGGALLTGTQFTVQLWGKVGASVPENQLELLATTTFRTGTGAGLVNALANTIVPNAPLDGTSYKGTFQIRAWNNTGGIANWAAATSNPIVPRGVSNLVSPAGDLGGTGTPPAATPTLVGLVGFNLYIVPEPSSIALGVLGLGTLMFLRRRK